jgi:hypothetical protein
MQLNGLTLINLSTYICYRGKRKVPNNHLPRKRISFAIFINEAATVLRAPLHSTKASCAACSTIHSTTWSPSAIHLSMKLHQKSSLSKNLTFYPMSKPGGLKTETGLASNYQCFKLVRCCHKWKACLLAHLSCNLLIKPALSHSFYVSGFHMFLDG